MLTLKQIDKYFNLAQVILFLGIVGIFVGYYIQNNLTMDISIGIELFVGFIFLVPLISAQVVKRLQTIHIEIAYILTKYIELAEMKRGKPKDID